MIKNSGSQITGYDVWLNYIWKDIICKSVRTANFFGWL